MSSPVHDFLTAFTGGAPSAPPMPPPGLSSAATMMTPQQPQAVPVPSARQAGIIQAPVAQPSSSDALTPPANPMAARRRYLTDQSNRILAKGGSTADVVKFMEQEGVKLPPTVHVAVDSPGYAKGLSQAAIDGATFGFGDEAIGSIVGLASGEGASKGIDDYRRSMAAFRSAHPLAAGAATLAGGLASALALPELGAAKLLGSAAGAGELSTTARVIASGIEGAAAGAVGGAGTAEGGLSDRARGALIGGTAGALLGAGGAGAVKTLGTRTAAPALAGALLGGQVASWPGAFVGGIVGGIGGKAGQRLMETTGTAIERFAERNPDALAARVFSALDPTNGSAALQARTMLRKAFASDGVSLDQAAAEAQRLHAAGVPVTVIDLGGDNVQALVGKAAEFRSPETQAMVRQLLTRQDQQGDRIMGVLFDKQRLGVANAYTAGDALVAKRLADSRPLYETAHQLDVQTTPEIRRAFTNPTFRQMYDEGRAIALQEDHAAAMQGAAPGKPVPPLQIVAEGPGGIRYIVDGNGGAQQAPPGLKVGDVANETLPVRGLDYMKRGLDQLRNQTGTLGAGPNTKPVLDRQLGTALGGALGALLDRVGEQAPIYGKARAAYKGPSDILDAMALGKGGRVPYPTPQGLSAAEGPRFTSKTGEEVTREIRKFTDPTHRSAYVIGALQDVADLMASSTAKATHTADAVFGSPGMEKRIRALFPEPHGPDANSVFDAIRGESTITSRSTKVAEASAPRGSSQMQEAAPSNVPTGIGLKFQVVGSVLRHFGKDARQQFTERVSNEVSALGTRGINGLSELQGLIESLRNIPTGHVQAPAITAGNLAGNAAVRFVR